MPWLLGTLARRQSSLCPPIFSWASSCFRCRKPVHVIFACLLVARVVVLNLSKFIKSQLKIVIIIYFLWFQSIFTKKSIAVNALSIVFTRFLENSRNSNGISFGWLGIKIWILEISGKYEFLLGYYSIFRKCIKVQTLKMSNYSDDYFLDIFRMFELLGYYRMLSHCCIRFPELPQQCFKTILQTYRFYFPIIVRFV